MTLDRTDSYAADVCLWLALVFPSSFVADKYLGWEGTIAYVIVVALVVALRPRLSGQLSNRSVLWLALLTWFVVGVAFLVVYPVVNTHAPGIGGDDDDASILRRWRFSPAVFRMLEPPISAMCSIIFQEQHSCWLLRS